MPAITPAVPGDTGYVDPYKGLKGNQVATSSDNVASLGQDFANRLGLKSGIWRFNAIADADTWEEAPPGSVACFVMSNINVNQRVSAFISSKGGPAARSSTNPGGNAIITFDTPDASPSFWLLVLFTS